MHLDIQFLSSLLLILSGSWHVAREGLQRSRLPLTAFQAHEDLTDSNPCVHTQSYTRMETAWKQLLPKAWIRGSLHPLVKETRPNCDKDTEPRVFHSSMCSVTGFNKAVRAQCLKKQREQIYKEQTSTVLVQLLMQRETSCSMKSTCAGQEHRPTDSFRSASTCFKHHSKPSNSAKITADSAERP